MAYDQNPKFQGKPPKKGVRDRYITPTEFKRLLEAAKDLPRGDRDYLLLALQGNLGLRVSEVVLLKLQHLNRLDEGYVSVPSVKLIKSGRSKLPEPERKKERDRIALQNLRLLPIHAELRKLIEMYCQGYGIKDWLFPGRVDGTHLDDYTARNIFSCAAGAAGLSPVYSSHSLRHLAGVMMYDQTKDLRMVQQHLRHTSLKHTGLYVAIDGADRHKEIVEKTKPII